LSTAVGVLLTCAGVAKALSRQHHVVLPEHDMGERVAHLLTGRILDYVEVDEDFAMAKTTPPREFVGVPLGQTRLRSRYGVTIAAVKAEVSEPGQPSHFTYATEDTVLSYGDIILVVGSIDDVERFADAI
jgi:trk system potassium uptake protein TrkA